MSKKNKKILLKISFTTKKNLKVRNLKMSFHYNYAAAIIPTPDFVSLSESLLHEAWEIRFSFSLLRSTLLKMMQRYR